jgi:formylmethanofuran dehydrogenase subunit E
MSFLSFSAFHKSTGPEKAKDPESEMVECPRCGRFFRRRGHEHEPLCKDCWKLTKFAGTA